MSAPALERAEEIEIGRRRRNRRKHITAYGFLFPSMSFLFVFLFVPLIASIFLSFTQYDLLNPPVWKGLENYERLFNDELFWRGLGNSFTYLIVTPILIVLSIALAIVVNRKLRGVYLFRTIYYIPAVTSVVAVGMIFEFIFAEPSGLINGFLLSTGLIQRPLNFLTSPRLDAGLDYARGQFWRGIGLFI